MAEIRIERITKTYPGGKTPAVRDVSLSIGDGELMVLLGPSGCGKTTTLRMIAGFEEPTEGAVLLYGRDVTDTPPNKRDVNMVFQSYALFPHMDIFANVAFGLRRHKVPKPEIAERVRETLELVELTGMEQRRPSQMSGGQRQRVALARALVNRPRALLLDEPLGALDLKLRQSMQIELKRIQQEVGITFVYVTHDQGEALTMSDRVAVMNAGRIEQLGTPREIYEQPATRFTAGFIGTSNILTGRVARMVDGMALLDFGADGRVLVAAPDASPGDALELTVRPEKIELAARAPDQGCSLRGTIKAVVYQGTSTSYTVTTATGADVVVFLQNAASSESAAAQGQAVWLTWRVEHSYALTGEPHHAAPVSRP
jgi:spermidine/putrescine transport system ATP-binding protein